LAQRQLVIGEHVLDIGSLRMLGSSDAQRLTPKSVAVLLELAHNAGQTVSRSELLDTVWLGTCPTPDVLTQAITDLRRVLGDDLHAPRYIETVPKVGYRLIAPVSFSDATIGTPVILPSIDASQVSDERIPFGLVPVRKWPVWAGMLAIVSMLLVVAAGVVIPRIQHLAPTQPRWQAQEEHALTAEPGAEKYPRISPDGTRIVYSTGDVNRDDFRVVVRSLEQARPLRLGVVETGAEFYPVWSSDGASIAFLRFGADSCRVILTPSLGGQERELMPCFTNEVNHFSWSPDGDHLLASGFSDKDSGSLAIRLFPLDGGAAQMLNYVHGPADKDFDARYSPDGRWIAFRRGVRPYTDLWLVSAEGGMPRQLTRLASRIRGYDWTRDGSALVFSSNHEGHQALYTVDIDDMTLQALGVTQAENPASSKTSDTIVYEIPRVRTQLGEIRLDSGDIGARAILASTATETVPAISPVDERLLFISDRSGSQQLWLHDPAGANLYPLTDYGNATLIDPVWRADGARALITVHGVAGADGLVEIDLATRQKRRLTEEGDDVRFASYGTEADSYLIVTTALDGRADLVELQHPRSPQARRRVLARDVGRVESDPVRGLVYFTRSNEIGLFQLDPRTGKERLVSTALSRLYLDGWRVVDGVIIYLRLQQYSMTDLRLLDPQSGDDREFAKLPIMPAELAFSVSPGRNRIVFARRVEDETDIGALTLHRSAP
jgi:Tol biopolymer transport system component/DNA-binding winged helix-turn-helix (wHTH) protein